MCFIFSKESNQCNVIDTDIIYEPLVQKCAEYLVDLEKVKLYLKVVVKSVAKTNLQDHKLKNS